MEKYKLLVPVDFSTRSINALKNAIAIAKRIESSIAIIHAVMTPVVFDDTKGKSDKFDDELDEDIENNLDHLLEMVPELAEFDHSFNVEYGLSPEAITNYTMQNEVDLIVMGTRGKNSQSKSLLGSNTWAVINSVKCPVLAVPEDGEFSNAKKIILAMDYVHIPSYESFEPLIRLSMVLGAQVNIIHIGKHRKLTSKELEEARVLEQYFKNLRHQYKYIKAGDEEEAILEYLHNQKARLLAIISKKYSIVEKLQHQSLTRQMIRDLQTPLLVLHDV